MKFMPIWFLLMMSFELSAHKVRHYPDAPLRIITIGHPTLYLSARRVEQEEFKSKKFKKLIDDMIHTMKKAGGVGLAAPQVNVSKRLFVIKPSIFKKAKVYVNPILEYVSEDSTSLSKESCLSIPGKSFKVSRFNTVKVSYQNRHGEHLFEKASGFKAIVIQHEYDHLNGTLISDIFENSFDLKDDFEFVIPRM